jgi:hypothetical protein
MELGDDVKRTTSGNALIGELSESECKVIQEHFIEKVIDNFHE